MYVNHNTRQSEMTADPQKYPQGSFKSKPCRVCGTVFSPKAPSHLLCSQACVDRQHTDRYLSRTYGITLADFEVLHEAQGGKCAICKGPGFLMREHHKTPLVVDHCHTTGLVRGLLCHNCNRALGLLQDDIESLRRALIYLEGATTIPEGSKPKRAEAHGPS